MQLEQILKVAVRGGASDIILKTGVYPCFRFNDELVPLSDGKVITPDIMKKWVEQILPEHLSESLQISGDADFSYESQKNHRFRVNLFRQRQTYSIVMRVIQNHIRTVEELQLPSILKSLALKKRGLVLVTGATGSGKTTTLAAMVQKINNETPSHIITIEDPIEFNFKDAKSTINQREIGIDTQSFASALRAALRQNPDIILVGELRDKETIETALMAAETGHLVLSTLHTLDAVESLTRIMSYFDPHQQHAIRIMLAQTLSAVISQRLVTSIDQKGMVAAVEVLISNTQVRDHILNAKDFEALRQIIATGHDTYSMQTFDQSLLDLYKKGLITKDQALKQASNRADMELLMSGVGA